jgi:hypothetical protein
MNNEIKAGQIYAPKDSRRASQRVEVKSIINDKAECESTGTDNRKRRVTISLSSFRRYKLVEAVEIAIETPASPPAAPLSEAYGG